MLKLVLAVIMASAMPSLAQNPGKRNCVIDDPPPIIQSNQQYKVTREDHFRREEITLPGPVSVSLEWGGCDEVVDQAIIFRVKKAKKAFSATDYWLDWARKQVKNIGFAPGGDLSEVVTVPAARLKGRAFSVEDGRAQALICEDEINQTKICADAPYSYDVRFYEEAVGVVLSFHYKRWV